MWFHHGKRSGKPVGEGNSCWLTRDPLLPKGSNKGGETLPAFTGLISTLLEVAFTTGRRQMGICARSSSQPSIPPQNLSHIRFNPVTCHLFWCFAREVHPEGQGRQLETKPNLKPSSYMHCSSLSQPPFIPMIWLLHSLLTNFIVHTAFQVAHRCPALFLFYFRVVVKDFIS